MGWTVEEWWLESWQEEENFVFSILLRPVLEFIELAIQWILEILPCGQSGWGKKLLMPCNVTFKNVWGFTFIYHVTFRCA